MIGRIVRRRPYRRPRSDLGRRPPLGRAVRRADRAARLVSILTVAAVACAVFLLGDGSAAHAAEPGAPGAVLAVDSIAAVVSNIRLWLMGILAAAATLFATVGFARLMWANGDPGEVEKGKSALRSAAIGYAGALLSPLLVTIVAGWVK